MVSYKLLIFICRNGPAFSNWISNNGRMEIIQENGEVRTCSTSTNFPLDVYGAAGSYMVDACQKLSSFVVVVMAPMTDAECYQLVNGEWQQMNNGLSTAELQHASSPTSSHQIWMTGVLVVMVKDCHQAPT